MNAIAEKFREQEARARRDAQDLRARYRKHLIAYNTDGAEVDPDAVLATCNALGKSYDDFLKDGEAMRQALADAELARSLPAANEGLRDCAAEQARFEADWKAFEAKMKIREQALRDKQNALLAKQAAAQAAEHRLQNRPLPPELLDRERPLIARGIELARSIRKLEEKVTGTVDGTRQGNLNNQLATLRERIKQAENNRNEPGAAMLRTEADEMARAI